MKIKGALYLLAGICMISTAKAQSAADQEAINKLCGCYSVSFNYAETFTTDTVNSYMAKPRTTKSVVEYAFPIEQSSNKIVIQHLLVIPDGRGTVIKHWREDWEYEQTTWWEYSQAQEWTKVTVPAEEVKGQWVQTVWEVEDAPRYAGSSNWVRTNQEEFWLNTTDAPLPRREFTKRSDYNILKRTNRIVVSEKGYVHEQDNQKILRKANQADRIIAEEKGYNTYIRLADSECASAVAFWTAAESAYWTDVREAWELKMKASKRIKIQNKVDGNLLYEALDMLYAQQLPTIERKKEIQAVLSKYVKIVE